MHQSDFTDPERHPVFTSPEEPAEQSARVGAQRDSEAWKRRWQLRVPKSKELLWPLGVAGSAAGRIGEHWSAERRTIAAGLVAFTVAAFAGLIGGLVLSSIEAVLEEFPGFMLLVPAAIGIRGNIFGSMASRIGTAMRLGTFELRFKHGNVLQRNLVAAAGLTVTISTLMGVAAWTLNILLGAETMSVWDFVTISIIGGTVASIVVYLASLLIVWLTVRFDLDLDSVSIPMITLIGDITGIPIFALAAVTLAGHGNVTVVIAILCFVGVALVLVLGSPAADTGARRIVYESLPLLAIVMVIDLLAGAVIESQLETLLGFTVFLIVLPAFLSASGGLGSTFVSRLGSKMHLGTVSPRVLPDPVALLDSTLVYLWGFFVFPAMALLASAIGAATGATSPGVLPVLEVTVLGAAISTTVALLLGYYTALVSNRFGLDPDNHGIPVVTSTMDLLGVIALAIALAVVV